MEGELDWRIIAVVAVVLIIIISAILVGTDFGNAAGFFTVIGGGPAKNTSLIANVNLAPIDFSVKSNLVILDVKAQGTDFYVGDQRLDLFNPLVIEMEDFEGKIKIEQGISLDGKASRVFIDKVVIAPKGDKITVKTGTLDINELELSDAEIGPLKYPETRGSLSMDSGKFRAYLRNDTFEIGEYFGDITISPERFRLNGDTTKVLAPKLSIQE